MAQTVNIPVPDAGAPCYTGPGATEDLHEA
jgi:hypothetical protein